MSGAGTTVRVFWRRAGTAATKFQILQSPNSDIGERGGTKSGQLTRPRSVLHAGVPLMQAAQTRGCVHEPAQGALSAGSVG